MLLNIKNVGYDDILEADYFEETHQCSECKKIRSFTYSTNESLETMKRIHLHWPPTCLLCQEFKEKGFAQAELRLF